MSFLDGLFLFSMFSIWAMLFMNIVLTYYGHQYSVEVRDRRVNILRDMRNFPRISIMIPAHNEGRVIERTLLSMIRLNYPRDKYEIIVINDNSSDDTGEKIEEVKRHFKDVHIKHIVTTKENGGKGKSNALNIGFKQAKGEFIVVYDADNTPNPLALRYLAYEIDHHPEYGAVIGMFRTRNKNKNWLTKFINIETLSFQWMAQAGRWKILKMSTIPGTNFIIRKKILDKIDGWDTEAIAEDTEISFRIYQMGYKISFMPLAKTFEQEPETIKVWIKQRTRWVNGNIYVLVKFIRKAFKIKQSRIIFDLIYFFSVYFFFLTSILVSDAIFLIGVFTDMRITISGNYLLIWLFSYLVFILQVAIALSIEKGENNKTNIFLLTIMYFSYCQLWLVVAIKGFISYIKKAITRGETKWYKTERF
ncbi:MAG: glycosyltransferase [Tissierellales bacterium]|jgi:cellulose synthase/poly-beta-1,6-N-acetylglucosamine synthase-like glycosyltransferase|nr:glycosyltransferase [Tissierellales bacterium]